MIHFLGGRIVVPALTLAVVVSIILLSRQARSASVVASPPPARALPEVLVAGDLMVAVTPTPSPTPTPTPTPTPLPSPVRIVIPAIGVDAPMIEVGVAPDGTVEAPPGPDEVAWTNGGARPGTVGNAVLSGHFDWSLPAPRGAIFYRLSSLKVGDKTTIFLSNGSELLYEVVSSDRYLAASAPAEKILAPSSTEIITMITCEGTFYRETRDYSHRRVVVARRILP